MYGDDTSKHRCRCISDAATTVGYCRQQGFPTRDSEFKGDVSDLCGRLTAYLDFCSIRPNTATTTCLMSNPDY